MIDARIFADQIAKATNILLVSHINPDGDTLGSSTGLAFYLKNHQNKKVGIFCLDPVPQNYKFLGTEELYTTKDQVNLSVYDLIITLDCADLGRTGIEAELNKIKKFITILNIDHHGTNPHFGHYNIVEAKASSTAEIIYKLLKALRTTFDSQIATNLLTGLFTDTTFFTNAATNSFAVNAAADLLNSGGKFKPIINNVWRNHNINRLKMWGKILSELQFNDKQKILTAVIDPTMEHSEEDLEGLANFLTITYEAKIILVLRQTSSETVKGSLRTVHDDIDVSQIAQRLGGGGHAKAAGFSVNGQLIKSELGWEIK